MTALPSTWLWSSVMTGMSQCWRHLKISEDCLYIVRGGIWRDSHIPRDSEQHCFPKLQRITKPARTLWQGPSCIKLSMGSKFWPKSLPKKYYNTIRKGRKAHDISWNSTSNLGPKGDFPDDMGRSTPPGVAHGAGCPHCIASTSSACGFASTETAKDAAAVASGACRAVCTAELAPNEGEIRRTSTAGNWGRINGAGDVACWIWRIGEMNDSVFTNLQIINDHKDEEKIRCLPL